MFADRNILKEGVAWQERYTEIQEGFEEKINGSGECEIETDEEYFYAVGQLVFYFISLSKAKEKNALTGESVSRTAAENDVIRRRD